MTYEMVISTATQILIVTGLIALVVSLITEYFIKALVSNITTQVLNVVVSLLSIFATFLVAIIYFQYNQLNIVWYTWVGVFVAGILVACICMNGYDKILSYIYGRIRNIFSKE